MKPLRLNILMAASLALLFLAQGSVLIGKGGVGHDEGWHAEIAIALAYPHSAIPLSFWPAMPWMRDTYNGALKTYILYLPFRLFGAGVMTLRWTTLTLGALSVFFLVLFIERLYGAYLGIVFGLFFATDPALILAACFDTGPAILMLLLKFCGFWFLAQWWYGKRKDSWFFAAGFMFGLGLSDKSHFLWFLFSLPLCAVFVPRRKLRSRMSGHWKPGLGGLLLGALPFIIFNLSHPLFTFKTPGIVGSPLEHFGRLPSVAGLLWWSLLMTLRGTGQWIAGTNPPPLMNQPLQIGAVMMAVLLLLCFWRKTTEALRHAGFWLLLSALIFLAACLSPVPVKWHHLYTIYPFPHLALAALIFQAMRQSPLLNRLRHVWLLPLAAACVFCHGAVLGAFHGDMDRTGGGLQFYRGIALVAQWLEMFSKENPGTTIFADDGFQSRLSVYSQGRLKLANLPPGPEALPLKRIHVENCLRLLKVPESIILLHVPAEGREVFTSLDAIRFLEIPIIPMRMFELSDGRPWAGIYRLQSPMMASFLKAREALIDGRGRQGDKLILEGLRRWRRLSSRLVRIGSVSVDQAGEAGGHGSLVFFLDEILGAMPPTGRLAYLRAITRLSENQRDIQDIKMEIGRALAAAEGALPVSPPTAASNPPRPWKEQEAAALEFQQRKEYGNAILIWDRLIREYPNNGKLVADRGLCEYLGGSINKATVSLERAIQLEPDAMPTYMTLAAIYMENKRYDAALGVLNRALAAPLRPENRMAHEMLLKDRESLLRAMAQRKK